MKEAYTKRQILEAISYWRRLLAKSGRRGINEAARLSNQAVMLAYWNKCQEICAALRLNANQESEQWSKDYICYYINDPKAPAGRDGGNLYFHEHDGTWEAFIQARKVAEGEYSVQDVMSEARRISAEIRYRELSEDQSRDRLRGRS